MTKTASAAMVARKADKTHKLSLARFAKAKVAQLTAKSRLAELETPARQAQCENEEKMACQ